MTERAGYYPVVRLLCLSLSLAVSGFTPAPAQEPGACFPPVATRAELQRALDSLPGSPRAAALARQGQPVVRWALEIAADTGGTPPATRAAALQVLRFARWKAAMPDLMRLAQPLRGPWVVWRGALSALAAYPYAGLTPYWLDLIRFPRRVVREDALRGLALTADERVLPMVREATSHEEDPEMLALAADVAARLRLPPALRDTVTFGWPPDSAGGRFIPSRSHLERLGCR